MVLGAKGALHITLSVCPFACLIWQLALLAYIAPRSTFKVFKRICFWIFIHVFSLPRSPLQPLLPLDQPLTSSPLAPLSKGGSAQTTTNNLESPTKTRRMSFKVSIIFLFLSLYLSLDLSPSTYLNLSFPLSISLNAKYIYLIIFAPGKLLEDVSQFAFSLLPY